MDSEAAGLGISSLLKYLKPYKTKCILGPLFKFIEAVLELLLPMVMAKVIDAGIASGDTGAVLRSGLLMLVIVIAGLGCALICQYVASVTSQGFGTELRAAVFKKITSLSPSDMQRFGAPSLVNRMIGDINQLQYAVAMLIRLVVRAPFLCVGGVVMAMIIDVKLSLIIMAVLPLFVALIVIIMRTTVRLHRLIQRRLDGLSLILRENLSGVRVVRAFSMTGVEQHRFSDAVNAHTDTAIRAGRVTALLNPGTQLIMNAAILAVVWLGGLRVSEGSITTGEVVALINYIGQILTSLIVAANLVITFTKAYASAGRVTEVLAATLAITDGAGALPMDNAPAVSFAGVCFSYTDGTEDELSDISFNVPAGARVGIIGPTGSGKSTLVNLIARFYDTGAGHVRVFGQDVRDYRVDELRQMIGMVAQKAELFTGTVSENIRWGNPDTSDEEVTSAAVTAQAHEFVSSMPEGYCAKIDRGGGNLSGGQRQRLSIARALVRRPRILILDDASSALDYATDAALRKALTGSTGGMTVFIVSQRVAAVTDCDLILVLDDGALVGNGQHGALLKSCEMYREICRSQGVTAESEPL